MTTVHRPRVVRVRAETPDGETFLHTMTCRCGVRGAPHPKRAAAVADAAAHCRAVAPEPDQRCQRPEHRARWWDRCALCHDQIPLFDLEEVSYG